MDVKERIIHESMMLFMKNGIRSVTMDDIAAELGISKRTIYENFKDKNTLLSSVVQAFYMKHEKANEKLISSSSNVIEAIFGFMQDGIKAINSINPVFFQDLKKFYYKEWKQVEERNVDRGVSFTHKLLRKGLNEGLFRKQIRIDIVSRLFVAQMKILGDERVFPVGMFERSEIYRSMMVNFIRGISTNKGIELIERLELK